MTLTLIILHDSTDRMVTGAVAPSMEIDLIR